TVGPVPLSGALGIAMTGVVKLLSPGFAVPSVAAELGAVSLNAVVVAHGGAVPVLAVDQPAGSTGATTPSKFCENAEAPVYTGPSTNVTDRVPKLVAPS